jgi:hypothetical protein
LPVSKDAHVIAVDGALRKTKQMILFKGFVLWNPLQTSNYFVINLTFRKQR